MFFFSLCEISLSKNIAESCSVVGIRTKITELESMKYGEFLHVRFLA